MPPASFALRSAASSSTSTEVCSEGCVDALDSGSVAPLARAGIFVIGGGAEIDESRLRIREKRGEAGGAAGGVQGHVEYGTPKRAYIVQGKVRSAGKSARD